jgi:hypothetical protein
VPLAWRRVEKREKREKSVGNIFFFLRGGRRRGGRRRSSSRGELGRKRERKSARKEEPENLQKKCPLAHAGTTKFFSN